MQLTAEQQQALTLLQQMQLQGQGAIAAPPVQQFPVQQLSQLADYADFGGLDATPLHKRPAILATGGVLGVLCLVGVGFAIGGNKPANQPSANAVVQPVVPPTPSLPIEAVIPSPDPTPSATHAPVPANPVPVVDPLSQPSGGAVQFGNARVNVPGDACLNLRSEPTSAPTDCLAPNTAVQIEYQSGDWANVVTQGGDRGWVYGKHLVFN